MKLKYRVVIYSWTGKVVNYLNPREFTTHIFLRGYCDDSNEYYELPIPQECETPRDIEMFAKGLECQWVIERKDINI